MSFFQKLFFYPTSLGLRAKIAAARDVLGGPFKWQALDALDIPGHGTDLLRLDFPPPREASPRWGHGRPPHRELAALLNASEAQSLECLRSCMASAADCQKWPAYEAKADPAMPWRDNVFLTPFDQAALYGMLRHRRPTRYVEIGSGMSTRIAWQARAAGGFPMEIVSIDPEPRLEISALCDRVFRERLESLQGDFLSLVTADTIVFFDGSHRSFPGSDVTVFFLEYLPRLPQGTVVHIHDIYLPYDYPERLHNRYWSEQYVLAAYLLGGGRGTKILLPCAYLAGLPAAQSALAALGTPTLSGSSFWLEKV